jgi:hypothetical protein
LSPEVRNSALAPQSVRASLRVAWLPRALLVPGSLREQQGEHWLVLAEAVRQFSLQLPIPRALSVVLREQQRRVPVK